MTREELNKNQWLADKYHKHVIDLHDGVSHCCDAPACSDYGLCSECGEHCEVITHEELAKLEIENQKPNKNK